MGNPEHPEHSSYAGNILQLVIEGDMKNGINNTQVAWKATIFTF